MKNIYKMTRKELLKTFDRLTREKSERMAEKEKHEQTDKPDETRV